MWTSINLSSKFNINSSFSFADDIMQIKFIQEKDSMCSFDFKCLFTSLLIIESSIKLCVNQFFNLWLGPEQLKSEVFE